MSASPSPPATDTLLARGHRLFAHSGACVDDYLRVGGYSGLVRANDNPDAVVSELRAANIRGRGGGWYPFASKLQAAMDAPGEPTVLVNGAEDEPGSSKDRHLLRTQPHLVLEGALVAARLLGARSVVLYVNSEAREALAAVHAALDELRSHVELDGQHAAVELVEAPPAYVAGEDTAAVEFVDSGVAEPRTKPPYPAESGIGGRPTLVSNVETLAHVALVARHGSTWYRQVGTPAAPGTMLVTLPSDCTSPGVYEVDVGVCLRDVLEILGGGTPGGPPRGVQVGGPAAGWIDDLDVTLDPESVQAAGSMLGCGALRVLPAGHCAVDAVARGAAFFSEESCGKCPPCRMSTQFHRRVLESLVSGGQVTDAHLDKALELTDMATPATACGLVKFPAAPLQTARALFSEDFQAHLSGGPCALVHQGERLQVGH